ncbi:hypothetical protein A4G20_07420 [Pasteurellaceae bacterium RH1A]|nr:hypothetical protein A4G20_07420 [Pasteurellaceae bacterium RH1A]
MPRRDLSQLYLKPHHLEMLLQIFQETIPLAKVWAYGSRVKGTAYDGRDLDLAVFDVSSEELARLRVRLQDSLLPILVDVHRWDSLPESFKRNIEQDYIVLQ